MRTRLEAVTEYIVANQQDLAEIYRWRFDETVLLEELNIEVDGNNWYEKNLELKRRLAECWALNERADQMRLANYYVREFGGIRANDAQTISGYVETLRGGHLPPFQGIASWSKIASIANCNRYAIFDARVAFALNAIQVLNGVDDALAFPSLPSRKARITEAAPIAQQRAEGHNGARMQRRRVYRDYLELLAQAAGNLDGDQRLARAEMVLFAKAEELAERL